MRGLGRKLSSFFLDIIQTIVLALSIFVIIYLFFLQPHQVRGNSMYPNFKNDEFLLTDKISYRFHPPKRGDVIIVKAPPSEPCAEEECEYIKRIVGLPGETVMVKEGSLFIDDKQLSEDYLSAEIKTRSGSFLMEGIPYILGEDEYLIFGDNRFYSRDGREFGPVKREAIIGRAWLRYWPVSVVGFIPKAEFSVN